MQLSSFVLPHQIDALEAAGGDYVDFFLGTTLSPMNDEEFEAFAVSALAGELVVDRFAGLLPADLKVTGPGVDLDAQDAYVTRVFERVRWLSAGGVVVFGSGGARRIPDGFDRATALDQLEDFIRRASRIAVEHDAVLTLEHLNRGESNVFNSLRESGEFLRERELDETRLVADLFHFEEESESLDVIDEFADLIVHAHVADTGRRAPGTGSYPIAEFFAALKSNGYEGRMSIECRWEDFDAQIGPSLRFLRDAAETAGY
jgi:sugar phosphate isomerase/epimerase